MWVRLRFRESRLARPLLFRCSHFQILVLLLQFPRTPVLRPAIDRLSFDRQEHRLLIDFDNNATKSRVVSPRCT